MSRPGLLTVALAMFAALAASASPRLVRVVPEVRDDQVVCRLETQGLPADKQLQTMRSGLESSVELHLALVDEERRTLRRRSISLRMGFDLWDEVYSLRGPQRSRRFGSAEELHTYLGALEDIPLAPVDSLPGSSRLRVEIQLVVHALAPDERRRVADVVAGDQRPRTEGRDEQEASVSLGRLIKLFYRGGDDARDGQSLQSGWFTTEELRR